MAVQIAPSQQVDLLKPYLQEKNSPTFAFSRACSLFQFLPGLRGFWPMSATRGGPTTGDVTDLSGNARHLTYNGNPTFNIYNDLVPYLDLDGTGDYLSWADSGTNDPFDILGNEASIAAASRGVTVGGWFWFDTTIGGAQEVCLSKGDGATNNVNYWLNREATTGLARFLLSDSTGTVFDTVYGDTALTHNSWWFLVGRFIPSTSVTVFCNGTFTTNSTGVTANMINSTAALNIGGYNGGGLPLNGRASLCFVSANALANTHISLLYESTRYMFNV